MWFWKIFVIICYLPSSWLDRGGCAPYSYFGVTDIVDNSDVQQPLLKSDSLKTPDRQVSEKETTNNIPTRGLFYPDDMFFTNWVPKVISTENCYTGQPSVTTPSFSTAKGTLQTKYNDKSTKHQTTLGQEKSTSAWKSSLKRQKTSTPSGISPSSLELASTSSVSSSSRRQKMSTFPAPSTSTDHQKSTVSVSSLSTDQKMATSDMQSTTNRVQTFTFVGPSSTRRRKMFTFIAPSLPRRRKPSTIAVTSSRRHQKMTTVDRQNIGNHPHNTDFAATSSTNRKLKSSFSVQSSSSSYRKSTRTSEATMDNYTPEIDYFDSSNFAH
ncbi:hypothetical protein QTP88_015805 [Uroleucon formosanum]